MISPVESPRDSGPPLHWAWGVAGILFCLMWAASLLALPLMKRSPEGFAAVAMGGLAAVTLLSRRIGERLTGWLSGPPERRFVFILIVLATVLRLGLIPLQPKTLGSDSGTYFRMAERLSRGGGFEPTAFLPPLFPGSLGLWFAIVPATPTMAFLFTAILGVSAVPVTYDLARRCLSREQARWAGLLAAILPTLVFTSVHVHSTSVMVLLIVGMLDLLLLSRAGGAKGWVATVLLGLLLGLTVLARPYFLLLAGVFLIAWLSWGHRRRAWGRACLTGAIALLVVAPWTIRNYLVMGAFIPVSTNGGYVLYNGLNPETDGLWSRTDPLPGETDEVSSDRIRRQAALKWLADHPSDFLRLAARKQAYMWGTSSTNIGVSFAGWVPHSAEYALRNGIKFLVNAGWTTLMVLCLVGAVRRGAWRRRGLAAGMLLVYLVFALHVLLEVQSRYHVPAIAPLLLIAAVALAPRQTAPARMALPISPAGPGEGGTAPCGGGAGEASSAATSAGGPAPA